MLNGRNMLFHGDNLKVMRRLPSDSIDLIYIDPPFFTQRDHAGFSDVWESMEAYLSWLNVRLIEMKRLLRGSIIVHLDWRVVHHVKIKLDALFEYFVNEIIWCYTGGCRTKRYFTNKHNTLLWYSKNKKRTFNILRTAYTSSYGKYGITSRYGKHSDPHPDGKPIDDVWCIPTIHSNERLDFSTQKPEALLERVIKSLSNPGDTIADFFCGSGTTLAVAQRLKRNWIGCDKSLLAIEIVEERCDVRRSK